ncbi:response regulator receiver protein [Bradyrhizobium macuxiense]|uniref:Response regulator receiver protein n=2 Tax=Bradyrhizobium macuxiense TaxID=1755647 RepID=A0A120FK32_9BRAD|nr:response regulator receiver protein [Bradyrhizobium macuxiense]
MLRGIKRLLREHGFESELFETAGGLLSCGDFRRAVCLILDINLSDGSGIELRRLIANLGGDLPVIYITGNDKQATRMAAMESGCIAYLIKPFTAQSLIQPIERALATRS